MRHLFCEKFIDGILQKGDRRVSGSREPLGGGNLHLSPLLTETLGGMCVQSHGGVQSPELGGPCTALSWLSRPACGYASAGHVTLTLAELVLEILFAKCHFLSTFLSSGT